MSALLDYGALPSDITLLHHTPFSTHRRHPSPLVRPILYLAMLITVFPASWVCTLWQTGSRVLTFTLYVVVLRKIGRGTGISQGPTGRIVRSCFATGKGDILGEKKRKMEAMASAKAQGSGKQPTGQLSGRQPRYAGAGGTAVSQQALRTATDKRIATSWTCTTMAVLKNLPLGAYHLGHCPQLGSVRQIGKPLPKAPCFSPQIRRANRPRLAAGNSATLRWVPRTPEVVAGGRVKGANARAGLSAQLPIRNGAYSEGRGGRDVKSSA
jgi:hypothetical protein